MVRRWLEKTRASLAKLIELPPVEDDEAPPEPKSVAARRRMASRGGPVLPERATSRVPPGQVVTEAWPRLDDGTIPLLADEDWTLILGKPGTPPATFTLERLRSMPMLEETSDIHCVTGWSRLGMCWKGIALEHLAEEAGISLDLHWTMARSVDGYCANLPTARLLERGAMIALEADGEPLTREHGGPIRLLVPGLYLWKSVKWLSAMELMEHDRRGTWEKRGYHNGGDPWLEQRWSLAERPQDGYPQW